MVILTFIHFFQVLLESARSAGLDPRARTEQDASRDLPYLLTFSANTSDALRAVTRSHEAYLRAHPENLRDLSYTLNVRREPLPYRAYSIVSTRSIAEPLKVSTFEETRQHQLIYVFTGQGAQWARMGASLLEGNSIFQRTIQGLELELSKCEPAPSWSLKGKSSLAPTMYVLKLLANRYKLSY
jgi:acyl transferase domain-containing protein